jgi:hypothetical protein
MPPLGLGGAAEGPKFPPKGAADGRHKRFHGSFIIWFLSEGESKAK